jgi:hypothetical protein
MSQGPNVYTEFASTSGWPGDTGVHTAEDPVHTPADPAGRTHSALRQVAWAVTGAFGLAAWAVGLAAAGPLEPAVTLSVLAGAVAVVGLLPGQVSRGWLAAALAVTAFADAMSTTVTAAEPTWVLIVVDVLVALQVVVAVAALLLEPRGPAVTPSAPENDYATYARYVQACQDYAERYGSYWPDEHPATGMADAAGHAEASAVGTVRGDRDAWADMQARYTEHMSTVAPPPSQRTNPQADGERPGDAGLPGVNRVDRPSQAPGRAADGSASTSPATY